MDARTMNPAALTDAELLDAILQMLAIVAGDQQGE